MALEWTADGLGWRQEREDSEKRKGLHTMRPEKQTDWASHLQMSCCGSQTSPPALSMLGPILVLLTRISSYPVLTDTRKCWKNQEVLLQRPGNDMTPGAVLLVLLEWLVRSQVFRAFFIGEFKRK